MVDKSASIPSFTMQAGEAKANRYEDRSYVTSMAYRIRCEKFLRSCNPFLYGSDADACSPEQWKDLVEAVEGLQSTAKALRESGSLDETTDPVMYTKEDPRNMWAYAGKLHRPKVSVHLPLIGAELSLAQFWMQAPDYEHGGLVDGHTTGSVLWDGAVCLADFLTQPTLVLLSHHAGFARLALPKREWLWKDKTVVELGAGLGLLSCTAAILGAKQIICTDGDGATIRMASTNAAMLTSSHPAASPVEVKLLQWGKGEEASLGVPLPVDVVVASDVLYVLDNPGAWGAFLRTLMALTGPSSLIFVTYTDRGHHKCFEKFVMRAEAYFTLIEVAEHLIHPTCQPMHQDRIERTSGVVRIFCLARKINNA